MVFVPSLAYYFLPENYHYLVWALVEIIVKVFKNLIHFTYQFFKFLHNIYFYMKNLVCSLKMFIQTTKGTINFIKSK